MKHKIFYMSALLALTAVTPAVAQIETVADDSLVNVAFRKVAKDDVLGGVSSINYRELMKKNYNTYSLDNMQGYVAGFNGNGMWGLEGSSDFNADNTPNGMLVLIDGVPRAANNVKPDEIEEITFLKGAQAVVLYGSRAAKGAILITTKRGRVNDGLAINVRANTGWAVAKSFPEYLGSAEYMTLYNEARANDGLGALYSQEDIYNYSNGLNPYRYPNVNMYSSDYIKKTYNRSDVTAEIEGGNERAKFYANVSYYREGDLLDFGEAKNNYTDRFNVRGNVDMRINQYITAYVNANATYYNSRSANSNQGNNDSYWLQATKLRPNRISPLIPISYLDPNAVAARIMVDNSFNIIGGRFLAGSQSDLTNIIADYYAAGYNTWTSRQFQFDAGVNVDLSSVLKGLTFHAMVAVDYATSYSTSYNNEYATFEPTWSSYNGKDVIVALNSHDTVDKKSGVQNISGSTDNQMIAFNAHFDYNRTFNKVHNVSAIAVINGWQQTVSGVYHKLSNANLGFEASYNYAKKYYADIAIAAPWSARLPEGNRAGVSPTFTLGWNLINEDFMKGSIFDELKVSASYSDLKTDLGINDYYMYQGAYKDGGWWDWNGQTGHSAVQSVRGNNPDFTYLHRKEFSVSLHTALLNKALTADFSFFTNTMTNGIIEMVSPSYFSSWHIGSRTGFVTNQNYNSDRRTGFDLALSYKKDFGKDFGLHAGFNLTHYTTKATKRDDRIYADAYQRRQGLPIDAIWGYECLGFFKDQADIDNSPQQVLGGTVRPGDLKYKDQNGDGFIDSQDQVCLGKGGWYGAPTTLGVNLTLKYKNFTLFMLGVGGFGGKAFKSNSYWWISGENKYSSVVRGRWTPETAETATYPRLTTQSGANNNVNSDFWLYSTSRFDLAKVQLTYDFPKSIIGNGIVKGLSVYASGNSLLTIAKERELLEMNVGSAPQTRFYNLGVQVSF